MNIDYSTYFPWGGKAEFDKKIISGKKVHTIRTYNRGVKSLSEIAKNDGMTIDEFQMWFYQYQINNTFNGYVIHWTDLKY